MLYGGGKTDLTHLICGRLPETKLRDYARSLRKLPVVSASWVVQSCREGRLLDPWGFVLPALRHAALGGPHSSSSSSGLGSGSSGAPGASLASLWGNKSNPSKAGSSRAATGLRHGHTVAAHPAAPQPDGLPEERPQSFTGGAPPSHSGKSSRQDPDFVRNYFRNSRLHFIGEAKQHMQHLIVRTLRALGGQAGQGIVAMRTVGQGQGQGRGRGHGGEGEGEIGEDNAASASGQASVALGGAAVGPRSTARSSTKHSGSSAGAADRSRSRRRGERWIAHVDMDCFFASVALLRRPEFKSRPVAVSHVVDGSEFSTTQSSGEISSCNYLARASGVRGGMWLKEARRLCPALVVLPYDFDLIARVAARVVALFCRTARVVEAVSVDEAYLDLGPDPAPDETVRRLRAAIERQTGCTASAGIARNRLLAKLATSRGKPNG